MQEKKLIFNVKELPHVFNVSMELTNITSDSEQENVKKGRKKLYFSIFRKESEEKKNCEAFYISRKGKKEKSDTKSIFH